MSPMFPRRNAPSLLSNRAITIALVIWSVSWCISAEEAGVGAVEELDTPLEELAQPIVIQEISDELGRGDKFYSEGDYGSAVVSYGIARDKLVRDPAQGEMKRAATERLAQASVEYAKQLTRLGKHEEAAALMETILASDVAPGYAPALEMQQRLEDPIRYNPSLDAQHVRNIDKVRRLLYEAEGFEDLGRYDDAYLNFEEVLKIDAYNTAARRGMERVNNARSVYYEAAYDELRGRMLSDVEAAWEGEVTPEIEIAALNGLDLDSGVVRDSAREKLNRIIVPVVDLEGVDLYEAVDFLREQSRALDVGTLNESERGLGIVIDLGAEDSESAQKITQTRFDLKLSNPVPLGKVLDYINAATSTRSRIDEYAIVIRPLGETGEDFLTRTYQVPPNFLSRESISQQSGNSNPFESDDSSGGGLLAKRMTAREFFEAQGVKFPEGASAVFQRGTGSLVVRNTVENLDFVDQIVNSINDQEPVAVIVEVTFVKVQESTLEELGFDWLMTPLDFGGEALIGGGTIGSGTDINDIGAVGQDPITAGNRSGAAATLSNSIDAAIIGSEEGGNPRAPGILTLTGVFNDSERVTMIMRGLQNNGSNDYVFKKSIVTRSGQVASVEVSRSLIYPTEYEPPEIPNSVGGFGNDDDDGGIILPPTTGTAPGFFPVTPATPTAFDTRKLGCFLEVEPLVGPDRRYITMSLSPALVEFDGFVDYGSPITGGFGEVLTANNILMPVFSKTGVSTSVEIADGATVVLGGLLKSDKIKIEDSVPILGDLPLVGRLFQSTSETTIRDALMIFVKARLVDPSGQPFRDR